MPVYDAAQLIGKSISVTSSTDVYNVSDINMFGDKAKSVGKMAKGGSYTMDSFLLPTAAYTNSYGLKYAARKYTYFTFYSGGKYLAVRMENVNTKALKDQGALTVADQIAKEQADNSNPLSNLFNNMFNGLGDTAKLVVKVAIVLAVIYIILRYLLPAYSKYNSTAKVTST